MRDAMNIQVPFGPALVAADLLAHSLGKDLRAAARQRVEAGVHQLAQHLRVGHAVEIGKERNLDSGEALQVDAGTNPLESAQQVCVVAERKLRVQSVDDVQLGQRLIGALTQLVPGLLERHRVGLGHPGLQSRERTEETTGLAHIGRLEAQVVVEVGSRAVALFTLTVCEPANGEQVRRIEQAYAVVERESLASLQLVVDVGQSGRLHTRFHNAPCPQLTGQNPRKF